MNSWRVDALSRKHPNIQLVTSFIPRLCTPRVVMHPWVAFMTTATPLRLQHFLNDVGYLSRQSFLNLKSFGEGVHHARHL